MARRPHRRKLLDDPLVSIDAEAVRSHMQLEGLSLGRLARELAATPAGQARVRRTLAYILAGRNRRARRSLVEALGERFGVSPDYLMNRVGRVSARAICVLEWHIIGELLRKVPRYRPDRSPENLEQVLHNVALHLSRASKVLDQWAKRRS
ncbi:MAG: hypothetical protein KatS3mg081_0590 [Gemmatimonadales bacterium]|nr:MAG: hypothetical protein KatS3mg081_0590 [Gemmatimonadales bacterium]